MVADPEHRYSHKTRTADENPVPDGKIGDMAGDSELWNTTDVARYLGVKPSTVSAYRHRRQMPPPKQTLGERTHLWDAATIRAWRPQPRAGRSSSVETRTDSHEWLVHGERDIYASDWVRLSLVDVEPPVGGRFEHHVVTMRPAAMTAILDELGEHVGLIWRHRFAPSLWNWELPGGLVDAGEDPEETARREVTEEVGLTIRDLRHLVSFEPVVGMVRSPHHVYAARAVGTASKPTEENEGDGLQWVRLDSVKARIDAGEILNSGTLVALLHLLAFGIE